MTDQPDPVTDPVLDGIDEGRRLIRLGGDNGLSLATGWRSGFTA
ncbi:hypothetical protein FHR74_001183 [Sphingomonas aerolata]|nr:hypothetical protein [Sphingomonas aerolata]